MGTEVVLRDTSNCFTAAPSTFDRPFKIIVRDRVFTIDSESLRKMSPVFCHMRASVEPSFQIFSAMLYGKDFENGRELSREIVDEQTNDIDIFLRAIHDPSSVINAANFPVILRLSNKYQVDAVIDACENYIRRQDLDVLKPDEVLTLLISAHEFHCKRDVMVKLIRRLASESNAVFTRLKISRYLPAVIYGAVISTSMNLAHLKEFESMNGHSLKMERSKIRWRPSVCERCSAIDTSCATCDECRKTYCKKHVEEVACPSEHGKKTMAKLRQNVVELEWAD